MNHYVYEITNKLNGMKYIGKRSCLGPIEEDSYMGSGKYLWEAYIKHGQENFEKKIVKTFATVHEALDYERELIKELDAVRSHDYYNAVGGGGGPKSDGIVNKNNQELNSLQLGLDIKFNLNPNKVKDKIIIDYLEEEYDNYAVIVKNYLYKIATGAFIDKKIYCK